MIFDILRHLELRLKKMLYPNGKSKVLEFGEIKLKINEVDEGGKQYDSKKSFEEITNPLYLLIENKIHPELFIDIGANYGFISIVAAKHFPKGKIIMVEPGRKLGEYIQQNMQLNGISNFEFHDAICGKEENKGIDFATNPFSSQDNRVIAPKKNWKTEKKKMVSVDGLLKDVSNTTPVFIKIDVQGFEEQVFKGSMTFLQRNNNWVIKTEFAPKWLSSQGSDPSKLLKYLVEKFQVVELPGRTGYQTKSLNELFLNPIQQQETDEFLKYIIATDRNERGWCDLLIRPKSK